MKYDVYIRRLAELDAAEAQDWYESKSPGLGAIFNNELGQALSRLEQTPLIGQRVYGQVRRIVLHRFPYLLCYRVEGTTVIVLACTHGRRDSRLIRSRLKRLEDL